MPQTNGEAAPEPNGARSHPARPGPSEAGPSGSRAGIVVDPDRRSRDSQAVHGGWAEALLDAEEPVLAMIGGDRPLPEVLDALCRMVESLCPGTTCSVPLMVDQLEPRPGVRPDQLRPGPSLRRGQARPDRR